MPRVPGNIAKRRGARDERQEVDHRDGDDETVEDNKSPEVHCAERRLLLGEYNQAIKVKPFGLFGEMRMRDGSTSQEGE